LPIITKKDIQDRFPADEIGSHFGIPGAAGSTGGSTGEPTHFYHDVGMVHATQAVIFYARRKMGWEPGMPIIIVWGSERDIGKETSWKARLDGGLRNEFLIDGYHLNEHTVERVLKIARKHAPVAIYGFTSMLEMVSEVILGKNEALAPGVVAAAWNGGEMLFERQRELFRKAFGIPLLNLYGGRELGCMAFQEKDNGPLNVLRPWLMVEVVDDAGRPVRPGETGRLLWTSTVCCGTPFLRYDVGDLGAYSSEFQTESGIAALAELQGRTSGLLELPDGRKINNIYWNHLFKEMSEVKQFQVTLRADDSVQLMLKGVGFSAEREQYLRTVLNNFIGPVKIDLRWVDVIPRTPQGKLLQVINERPMFRHQP
jgi:phenylacetate-CoA ligase